MGAALKLIDETPTREVLREMTLELVSDKVTARELIESRVRAEVDAFHAQQDDSVFFGLVQPTGTEAKMNGYRLRKPRRLDADAQVEQALKAFTTNGFFILVGDRQVESLDEEIALGNGVRVSFIKLVPLVGG